MRNYFIILTILLAQILNAQDNISDMKSFVYTIENVEQLSNLKAVKFESLSIITTFDELKRKIDFGYEHHRILIMSWNGELKLNIISRDQKIKIVWLSEFNSSKEMHSNILTIVKDSIFLENYISKHNKFYQTKLTHSDFKNQTLEEIVVGFGCGEVGLDIPKESQRTLRLAKKRNRKELNKYLTSFSLELQTLGAIGLLKIGKLSNEQKLIIEHLKKRNSVIYSCSGCLYGIGETFSELIKYYE